MVPLNAVISKKYFRDSLRRLDNKFVFELVVKEDIRL